MLCGTRLGVCLGLAISALGLELPTGPELVRLYERGVARRGLEFVDPTTLACLYLRTGNASYGRAASTNLAAVADPVRPRWLADQKEWNASRWLRWELTSQQFEEPARFSGCTDYGLLGYLLLKKAKFDLGWSPEQASRFKKVHQVLCYVWFSGAWNQGEWMGLGNSIMSLAFPETADQRTPWMYPRLTRREHSAKVYNDFFEQQIMMEDADGYNEIWTVMMLIWPEVLDRPMHLRLPGVTKILRNFAGYLAPDGALFQYASGLEPHYASLNYYAAFERAASLTGDGWFRGAAAEIYNKLLRNNQTIPDLVSTAGAADVSWAVAYGLLCGRAWDQAACGSGWVNGSIPVIGRSSQATSRAHSRRELSFSSSVELPDKTVMRSNKSFVTLEAHTGRSLFHSHTAHASSITNWWIGQADWAHAAGFLMPTGKHDFGAHGNQLGMQMLESSLGLDFPQHDASSMYQPGQWNTQMMPTRMILPTVDLAGPAYLKRNFSALGISCDNWMNHTINLTVLPIMLHPVAGGRPFVIDDFTHTAALWTSPNSKIVHEPTSPSQFALEISCVPSERASCGPLVTDPRTGSESCPQGCVSDGSWCQVVQTSYVNRQPSTVYPLPTEIDPGNTVDVTLFESFNLQWKVSTNYVKLRSPFFPIGIQTTRYPAFSNNTLSFFGNSVRELLGNDQQKPALQTVEQPPALRIDEGAFWPIVSSSIANSVAEDMFSEIVIARGYYTSGTATTRRVISLREGILVVVDTVTPDEFADGWTAGPSFAIVTGPNGPGTPGSAIRPSMISSGNYSYSFAGFEDVMKQTLDPKTPPKWTNQRLTVAFPPIVVNNRSTAQGKIRATKSVGAAQDPECTQAEVCPLSMAWYCHVTRRIVAHKAETFVAVLVPYEEGTPPTALVEAMSYQLGDSGSVKICLAQIATIDVIVSPSEQTRWVVNRP